MSAPNQKLTFINRAKIDTKNPKTNYFIMYTDYYFLARNKIKTLNGMDAYIYLASQIPHSYDFIRNRNNNNDRPYEISPQGMHDLTGIDRTSCQRGINRLIEVGYLKLIKGNTYQFTDILPEDMIQTLDEHNEILQYEVSLEESLLEGQRARKNQLEQNAENNIKDKVPRKKYDWE